MRDPGQSSKPEASDSGTTNRHHALLVACTEMQYNRRHEHKKVKSLAEAFPDSGRIGRRSRMATTVGTLRRHLRRSALPHFPSPHRDELPSSRSTDLVSHHRRCELELGQAPPRRAHQPVPLTLGCRRPPPESSTAYSRRPPPPLRGRG
ncbi:hypothetical protein E2562_000935 [Oryza meyeriana var. granulata]|uniref:Uncharacterized protein n=1 Tax=Oryza meyeriana var. granulata TaxID=110450 RepID=A0A6G1CXE7_9ORYZ|nr:hypothetical protein E2562_000935 [Oryza meyeriana var. granulata]